MDMPERREMIKQIDRQEVLRSLRLYRAPINAQILVPCALELKRVH